MNFILLGLGLAVPEDYFTQEEAVLGAAQLGQPNDVEPERVKLLYQRAGVQKRHTVLGRAFIEDLLAGTRTSLSAFLPGPLDGPTTGQRMAAFAEHAWPPALSAARRALQHGNVDPKTVTHLVTVSCTGFAAPGVERKLIEKLGLPATTERIHVGFMGCHAAVNGLRVVAGLAAANPDAVVLMVAVELCTLHHCYRPTLERVVANTLFADGAAAVVGRAGTDGWRVAGTASILIPETDGEMSWTIGDHGFTMTLSRHVSEAIRTHLKPWLTTWLAKHDLTPEQVGQWAVHPGGPKILDAVAEAMSLPPDALDASRYILQNYGNMSSPTVLFTWDRLRKTTSDAPCVMLAFGPGLTAEAALLMPPNSSAP